ncbi:hypothetical protein [Bradyrhizobium sp. USDA 4350]
MTPDQARAHLARLKLTVGDFERLMAVGDRTARRWLSGDLPIPRAVEIALTELTPAKLKKWIEHDEG